MANFICNSCAFENPVGAKFCMECGTKLSRRCRACGTANPAHSETCSACGSSLIAPPIVETPSPSSGITIPSPGHGRLTGPAERRHLTVMFCDLVGSTPLAEMLDPEEMHQVLESYQAACTEIVAVFRGHVAKFFGDGVVAFFGYPQAHEDDAERAVRAGLRIVEQIPRLHGPFEDSRGIQLAVRVGIHTGLVVAGELGAGDRKSIDIVGETPNLAARLQDAADPNTVVTSASTQRLVSHVFEIRSIGVKMLRGLSRPIEVFQVAGHREHQSAAGTEAQGPNIVGRERELKLLLDRWEHAERGEGQVVLLEGDAGIGKTRLCAALQAAASARSAAYTSIVRCSAHFQSSPFYPVVEVLQRQALGFIKEDSASSKIRRLEEYCEMLDLPLPATMPVLASLLLLQVGDRYPPLNLSPEGYRQKTLDLVTEIVMRRAHRQPLLLVIENVHWADPSTLELLRLIIERSAGASAMILITYRPGFHASRLAAENVSTIALDRLQDSQVRGMVEQISSSYPLPADVVGQIVSRTDGVPLFVEELTKTVMESSLLTEQGGAFRLRTPLNEMTIPTTLQDSLMARLDRLSGVKGIAQVAAIIGREFTCSLLAKVIQTDETTLRHDLEKLIDAELLQEIPDREDGRAYRFKHALIQDAAYNSLLISRRQQYHLEIAEVIEKAFPETAENQPELVAGHYAAGNVPRSAITYWVRAGQRALMRSANQEAIADFTRVLQHLGELPESPETLQLELLAQTSLGIAVSATRGFAAPGAGAAFSRAGAICEMFGETPQVFPVLWGLWAFYLVRGELQTARTTAEQLLRMGETADDAGLRLEGHFTLGDALFWMGELDQARDHLNLALELYDPGQHRSHVLVYGQDPAVISLCYLGYTLWHLGFPNAAMESVQQALALSHETDHPFTVGWALGFCSVVSMWRHDVPQAREMSQATIRYCTEQGHAFWLAAGTFVHGWARFEGGDQTGGLEEMHRGFALYCATGSEVVQPHFLGIMAEASGEIGQPEEGLKLVEEGMAKARAHGEIISEIDLHRVKGQLFLIQDPADGLAAEVCFQHAIAMAYQHGSKMLELKAATVLARLLHGRGKTGEARALLEGIYNKFAEGFGTGDMKDAAAMLMEWSSV